MLKRELDGGGVEEEDEANDDQLKEQLEEHKYSADGQMEIETTSQWKERDDPLDVRPVSIIQPRTTLNINDKTSPYELFEKIIGNQLWPHLVKHAPFVGLFKHLVYNPLKPDKWGIKVYDANTGFVFL